MEETNEVIFFGLGGVGSWAADFAARSSKFDTITLVDFDTVEEKNLQRQDYQKPDIGYAKCEALKRKLERISKKQINAFNRKINDRIDLMGFNKSAIAVICTDNITSKKLIAKAFDRFLIANCDFDFVEVKNCLDDTDEKAWDMGGGYTSRQNITSNIQAAVYINHLLSDSYNTFISKNSAVFEVETHLNKIWSEGEKHGNSN